MAGLANYRNAQNAYGNSAKKRTNERWQGRRRQCRRGARGDQKGILAHRAEALPGSHFAALQQIGECERGPKSVR